MPAPLVVVPEFVFVPQPDVDPVPAEENCQPWGKAFVVVVCVIPLKFCVYDVPESVAAVVAWADVTSETMSGSAIGAITRTIRHSQPRLRRCHGRPRWRGTRALRFGGRGVVQVILDVLLVAFMLCLASRCLTLGCRRWHPGQWRNRVPRS